MDMIGKIRRLHARDKLSEREIARKTGLSRNTVSKWLRAPVNEAPNALLRRRQGLFEFKKCRQMSFI